MSDRKQNRKERSMKVVIASHGHMASGMKSSLEILLGPQEELFALDAYVDGTEPEQAWQQWLEELGDEKAVVFTDLMGGSVNQLIVKSIPEHPGIHVVTGVNLALVFSLLAAGEEMTEEEIRRAVREAQEQMQYMNDLFQE